MKVKFSFIKICCLISLVQFSYSCKKDSTLKKDGSVIMGKSMDSILSQSFKPEEVDVEKNKLLQWLEQENDCTIFYRLFNTSSTIFPLLYSDRRLKINYFISRDTSFSELSLEKRKKLDDAYLDDFELSLINSGIVKSIDFSWQGTINLGGKRIAFSKDGKSIELEGKTTEILETVLLSPMSRIYVLSDLIR